MKNHSQNVVEKLFPDPFLKNQNWTYLWINSLKFHTVCFYCMTSGGLSDYIKTKLQTSCFYLVQSYFKKQMGTENSLPASFSAWLLIKTFLLLYSINWLNFIVWLPLIRGILDNTCVVIVFNQVVTSWNLKLTLSF